MRRPWTLLTFLGLLLLALGACGGQEEPGEGVSADKRPAHVEAPLRETPDLATPEEEAELRAAWDAIAELERQCAPRRGAPRADVEARFGEGRATLNQKGRPDGPVDSPWRAYLLDLPPSEAGYPKAGLIVRYDADWKVVRASFQNPFAVGGRLPYTWGAFSPKRLNEQLRESLRQVEHLRRVRAELQRRFGD